MRLLALVGLLGLLSGCGVGVEEGSAPDSERTEMGPPESWCRSYTTQQYCPKYICYWDGDSCELPPESVTETTQMGPPESWCRSYTTEQYCPKNICFWYGTYCSLPTLSESATPEETTQMGPSERWCNSYTTQQYCPSVCAWYSYPAPGYCGLKATSVTGSEQ